MSDRPVKAGIVGLGRWAKVLTKASKKSRLLEIVAGYSRSEDPWVRVYKVIPGVSWTHRAHLAAGVKCETCHGNVSQIQAMSEVTSVVTMFELP